MKRLQITALLCWIVILFSWLGYISSMPVQARPMSQAEVSSFTLAQITFNADHSGFVECSEYGELQFTYFNPSTDTVEFLQVVAERAGASGWIVQNMPLPPSAGGEIGTTIALSPTLGIPRGLCLDPSEPITLYLVYTADPTTTVPTALSESQFPEISPLPLINNAEGDLPPGSLASPSLPPPPDSDLSFELGSVALVYRPSMPNIEQGDNECGPGAVANSMHWLADKGAIPEPNPDPNTTLDELKDDMQPGWSGTYPGVGQEDAIKGKMRFAKSHGLDLDIRYQADSDLTDLGESVTVGGDTVNRDGDGGKPTFDYLLHQMRKGEDVELSIDWLDKDGNKTGGHVVAVSGAIKVGSFEGIWFNDDESQDEDGGLRTNHWARIEDESGYMRLGGLSRNRVKAIYVESPKPKQSDQYSDSMVHLTLQGADGRPYDLTLQGPSTVDSFFDVSLADFDLDGREEVPLELTELSLTSVDPAQPATITLRNELTVSTGLLEEQTNTTSDTLDFPAESFFDVFFEIDIDGDVYSNASSISLESISQQLPFAEGQEFLPGDGFAPIPLQGGGPALTITDIVYIPDPEPPIIELTKTWQLRVDTVVTFAVHVKNSGQAPLTDLTLVDGYPAHLAYKWASPTPTTMMTATRLLTWQNPAALPLLRDEVMTITTVFTIQGGGSEPNIITGTTAYTEITATASTADLDFGDAPDPTYPTRLVNDGARHFIQSGLRLGSYEDGETDGQPNAAATGDDIHNSPDDEDGVQFHTLPLTVGHTAYLTVTASTTGYLDAWLDFNADGDWADPPEHIFDDYLLQPNDNVLSFTVPLTATATNTTYLRFRFSSQPVATYTGLMDDGEVEDYRIAIGDRPIYLPVILKP